MKKIISVLAMALLVIGAAQAQNQVRKMVVRTANGDVTRFKTAEIEEVNFELNSVPTTVEEAEAMLVGYWKCNNQFMGSIFNKVDEDIVESTYIIVSEDLWGVAFKIADSCTDEEFGMYAGQILLLEYSDYYGNNISVNSDDPTTGDFFRIVNSVEGESLSFKNLDQNSFDAIYIDYRRAENDLYNYNHETKLCGTFNRVEPFEYVIPGYGLMKNGLMKK